MNKKLIVLTALLTGLNATALFAQNDDVVVTKNARGGSFSIYGDYFRYTGAGAPGDTIQSEISAINMYLFANVLGSGESMDLPLVPRGNMVGTTLGYSWKNKLGENLVQFSYRTGNIDSTVTELWDSDSYIYETVAYKQKTNEYHLVYSIPLPKSDYIKIGLECAHLTYDGTFTDKDADDGYIYTQYGFKSSANEVLAHGILDVPQIPLISSHQSFSLSLQPRMDVGFGYSLRSASLRENHSTGDYFYQTNPDYWLSKNAWVLEMTAAAGLSCTLGKSSILAEFGYRYKNSNLSSHTEGNTQQGIYFRVGYKFAW